MSLVNSVSAGEATTISLVLSVLVFVSVDRLIILLAFPIVVVPAVWSRNSHRRRAAGQTLEPLLRHVRRFWR